MNNNVKERLAENGVQAELENCIKEYEDMCDNLRGYLEVYSTCNRNQQGQYMHTIREQLPKIEDTMELLYVLFKDMGGTPQKTCFAYTPNKCLVLTDMLCKKGKCSFFKTQEEYKNK